jgi:hypothetical protein
VSPPRFLKNDIVFRHLPAVVLLLAVFALPFHLHFFTSAAQITQECSCYHGVRTQTGLAPAPSDSTPTVRTSFVDLYEPQSFTRLTTDSRSIRAPPSLSAL